MSNTFNTNNTKIKELENNQKKIVKILSRLLDKVSENNEKINLTLEIQELREILTNGKVDISSEIRRAKYQCGYEINILEIDESEDLVEIFKKFIALFKSKNKENKELQNQYDKFKSSANNEYIKLKNENQTQDTKISELKDNLSSEKRAKENLQENLNKAREYITRIEKEKSKLSGELETRASEITNLEQQLKAERAKNRSLEREKISLDNKKKELQSKIKSVESLFEIQELFDEYQNVSPSTAHSLNNFLGDNIVEFVGSLGSTDEMDTLWDNALAISKKNEDSDDLHKLYKIFEYSINHKDGYELIIPENGSTFDGQYHTSKDKSGEITKTIFYGYKIGNRVKKPAIVKRGN